VGVALIGLLGAFALPMLAAGAQTATTNGSAGSGGVPPAPPGTCTFDVTPNPIPGVPQQFTISGNAPTTDNTLVQLYVNGVPATPNGAGDVVTATPTAGGTYTLLYTITSLPADNAGLPISVNFSFGNQNAYTADCTGPGGATVILVKATEAARPQQQQAAALAFTGSSDTPSYVLIGIAAVVVGAVLVVAARRRSQVS
jgi:LPXTG-motif cell wall-anchored protein